MHSDVKTCPVTFALINADEDISPLYSDAARDKRMIAVVEEPLDIVALERTGQFKGTYHVLGGTISPIDGIGPEQLHIPELLKRIRDDVAVCPAAARACCWRTLAACVLAACASARVAAWVVAACVAASH